MQIRPPKNPGREPSKSGAEGAGERTRDLEQGTAPYGTDREQESDPDAITSPIPNITKLPEGYEVVEQKVGRAVGQWVLMVRCQCGRRWFEVEAIEAATCPRCGLLVYVETPRRGK